MKRRIVLAATSAVVVQTPSPVVAQELAPLRVVGPANDGLKVVWYGIRSGLFRRYGLNVDFTAIGSGAAAAATVIGGSAEVGLTALLVVFQAYLRDIPLQVVAPSVLSMNEKPLSAMIVLKDSPLHTASDLNGKTLSSPAVRDLNDTALHAWIDKNGGDSKTVKTVELPATASLPALEAGRIDVATMFEPALTQALETGRVRIFGRQYEAVGNHFQLNGFVAMGTYVARNHDVMARFAQAMHESIVYTNAHLPETVDLVASYTGVSPEVIAHSVRFIDPEYVETRNIQPLIDVCVKYGALDRGFRAEQIISPIALKPPSHG